MYDMLPVVDPVRFGSSGIHHSSTARNKIILGNHVPGPWPRSPFRCARQPGRAPTRYNGPRQCTPARAPLPPLVSPFVVLRLEPACGVHAYAAAEECRERQRGGECTWRPVRHRRSLEGEQAVWEGNGALRRLDMLDASVSRFMEHRRLSFSIIARSQRSSAFDQGQFALADYRR